MHRSIILTVLVTVAVGVGAAAVILWPPDKQLEDQKKVAELSETARRKAFYFSKDFVEVVPRLGLLEELPKDKILALVSQKRESGELDPFADLGETPEQKVEFIQKVRSTLKAQYEENISELKEGTALCDEALKIQPNDPLANETKALLNFARSLELQLAAGQDRTNAVQLRGNATRLIQSIISQANRVTAMENGIPTKAIGTISQELEKVQNKAKDYEKQANDLEKTIKEKKDQLKNLGQEREADVVKLEKLKESLRAKTGAEARAVVDQMSALKKAIIEKDLQSDRLRVGSRVTSDGKLAPIQQVQDPKTLEMIPKVSGEANEHGLETLESFDLPLAKQRLEGWKKTVSVLEADLKTLNAQKVAVEQEKTAALKETDVQVAELLKTLDEINALNAKATKMEDEALTSFLPQAGKNLTTAFDEAKKRKEEAQSTEDSYKTPDKRYPALRFRSSDQISLLNLKSFKGDTELLSGLLLFGRLQAIREQRDLLQTLADNKKNLETLALKGTEKNRVDELVTKVDAELKTEELKTQRTAMEQLNTAREDYEAAREIQKVDSPSDDLFNQTRKNTLWATSIRLGDVYWLMSQMEPDSKNAGLYKDKARSELGEALTELEGNPLVQPSLDLLKLLGGKLQGPAPVLPTPSAAPAAEASGTTSANPPTDYGVSSTPK